MVTAHAFRGLRYDPAVAGDPAAVTAPPTDAITPDTLARYAAASPYNVVRLLPAAHTDLTTPTDDGTRAAAALLHRWLDAGVLVQDPRPSLYAYEQTSRSGATPHRQRGVVASVPLDPTGRSILPHEHTIPRVVEDRRRLLAATHLNVSPIFALYAGGRRAAAAAAALTAGPPDIAYTDDTGTTHRLWQVTDHGLITGWQAAVAGLPLLIADGHHRYRAALAHRAQVRAARPHAPDGPWDEVLMVLADATTDGPTIGAIHRLCTGITPRDLAAAAAGWADVHPLPPTRGGAVSAAAAAARALDLAAADRPAFGLLGRDGAWLLTARSPAAVGDGRLDVEVLHRELLTAAGGGNGQVTYEPDVARAAELVDGRAADVAVLLRPAPVTAVLHAARSGRTLPQKTTRFHPKPRDGMVLRRL